MTSDPPDSWYDPPVLHEIDLCLGCHRDGHHEEDLEWWATHGCDLCKNDLNGGNINVDI